MVSKIRTVAFRGIDVLDIDVEVQIANGLPAFNIVEYIILEQIENAIDKTFNSR